MQAVRDEQLQAAGPGRLATTPPATWAALGAAFVAGALLRWYVLSTRLAYVDLDEATVALQARDYFARPDVFFPAQPYGGALEVPFIALLAELGASGPLALKLVPMGFHLAACALAWRVAVRVIPSMLGQAAVPALLWCWPAYGVWASTKARGFYGAAIVLAIGGVWLGLRLLERPTRGRAAALGVGLGLACWATPLLAAAVVPMLVWLGARRAPLWRLVPWTALGALGGAAPWLVWNARNGWASLEQQATFGSTAGERMEDAISRLPQLIGFVTPWAEHRTLVPGADTLAYVLLVAALAAATLRTWRRARALLPALVVGYLLVLPLGTITAFVGADLRYLYALLPVLALVLGATLPALPWRPALLALVALSSALSWWGIRGMASDAAEGDLFLAAPGLDDVVDRLEQDHVRYVLSDIAGYQITYATDGDIAGTVFNRPRFPHLERVALVEVPSTYVLLATGDQLRFEEELQRRGISFTREQHGVWVLYQLDTWLPPWEAGFRLLFGEPVPRPAD